MWPEVPSTLIRDFLLHHDRPIRVALPRWALEVRDALTSAVRAEPLDYESLAACMNVTALLEAHRGNMDSAQRICEKQLEWIARRVEDGADDSICRWAFQPWINWGRLLVLRGDVQGALAHFRLLEALQDGDLLELGACSISPEAFRFLLRTDPRLRDVLQTVYVVDSLKAYFRSRDFDAALAFLSKLGSDDCAGVTDFVQEGQLIALANLGLYDRGLELVAKGNSGRLYSEAVFLLHQAAILADSGQRAAAAGTARKLAGLVCSVATGVAPASTMMRYLFDHGSIFEDLGEDRYAAALYREGLTLAQREGDEPLEVAFLTALLRVDASERRQRWADEREHVLSTCLYAHVLRVEGIMDDRRRQPVPVLDDLLETVILLAEA